MRVVYFYHRGKSVVHSCTMQRAGVQDHTLTSHISRIPLANTNLIHQSLKRRFSRKDMTRTVLLQFFCIVYGVKSVLFPYGSVLTIIIRFRSTPLEYNNTGYRLTSGFYLFTIRRFLAPKKNPHFGRIYPLKQKTNPAFGRITYRNNT